MQAWIWNESGTCLHASKLCVPSAAHDAVLHRYVDFHGNLLLEATNVCIGSELWGRSRRSFFMTHSASPTESARVKGL